MKLSKTFSVWALALLAAFTCFTINLQAAVPLGTTQSFGTAPAATEWATVSIAGNAATFADTTTLDAAIQTNTQANISTTLPTTATVPPGTQANARWNSSGLYLQTRPTGNGATLLKATLINNGALAVTTLDIGYDLNTFDPAGDTPPAHQVYYNMDGSANNWILIPVLSGDGVAGAKAASVDLSATPLASGGTMYLLWADDNNDGSTDPSYTIDNFLASAPGDPPVVTDPANATVLECRTATFSAQASGSPPMTIQWLKDGSPIDTGANPSAATSTLVISNARPSDAASYQMQATNPFGTDTSAGATLAVTPDNVGPTLVYAIGLGDLQTVVITYNEPMDLTSSTDNFNTTICDVADPNTCLLLASATLSADGMTVTWTTSARTPGVSYEVTATVDVLDACNGNRVLEGATIALNTEVPILVADAVTQWKYHQDGVDLGTTWKDTLFDDSGWSNGAAALAVEDTPPADPALRTVLSLVNGPFNTATTRLPTYYFRTHFNFPGDPTAPSARLKIRTAFDDYGYVYINGVEVYRDPFLGAVGSAELPFASYTAGTAIGNYGWGAYINIPLTSVVQGDNVVAVQAKQQAGGSSDIGMALEIVAELPAVIDECPTITDQPDTLTVLELQSASFSVTANGTSLQYEWQKDGTPIVGAPSIRTYSIPVARPSHNGVYRVRVFNNCAGVNSVLSDPATLMVTPKTSRPRVIDSCGLAGETNITINFTNGPLNVASAQNPANYSVSGGVTVQSAVLAANGQDVTLTTTARTIGNNYSVTITGVIDDAQTPNLIDTNPTTINPLAQLICLINWHDVWSYDANCQDGTGWEQPGFDDSAWATGPAVLGVETTAATLIALTNITGDGVLTAITAPNAGGANNHYFRRHFTLPTIDLTAVTWEWNHVRDDGAIVHLNGPEVFRGSITNGAGIPVVCLDQATSHEADHLDTSAAVPTAPAFGDNVVAVLLKQNGTNSSDIVWAMQLCLKVSEFRAPRPEVCTSNESLPNGSRVVTIGPCPGSPSAAGYRLQQADSPSGPWTDVPGNPSPYVLLNPVGNKFYRLCQGVCP